MIRRTLIAVAGLTLIATQLVVGTAPAVAATVSPDVNITKMSGNQSEAAIAIDPLDSTHVIEVSNKEHGSGMVLGVSHDGGLTWSASVIANGDAFGSACCDPTMSWDQYGNLFLAWLDMKSVSAIPVAVSIDGGDHFTMLKVLHPLPPSPISSSAVGLRANDGGDPGDEGGDPGEKPNGGDRPRDPSRNGSSIDQPTITTGSGSVWVDWNNNGSMQAVGAPVTGLGQWGRFSTREDVPSTRRCSFGDLSIGPDGQVALVCTRDQRHTNPVVTSIKVGVDPDGLGPAPFGKARVIGTTNVQQFDPIRPQKSRTVDAETGFAWDLLPTSPHFGRLYLVYTDENPNGSSNSDIWLRTSDDSGANWSAPVQVNDVTTNAQFLSKIAIDPTTGAIAIAWHDARNDVGHHSAGDTDGKRNTDAMLYMTFSADGGASFSPAVQVSAGISNAVDAKNGIDYGDYIGLVFFGNIAMPAWADNSNSTGDNPAGQLGTFDIYTAQVSCC